MGFFFNFTQFCGVSSKISVIGCFPVSLLSEGLFVVLLFLHAPVAASADAATYVVCLCVRMGFFFLASDFVAAFLFP